MLIVNPVDSSQILITNPDDINKFANSHFQNIAGGAQTRQTVPSRWANQYVSKENINTNWYNSVMDPPPMDKWQNITRQLPISKWQSYQTLRHFQRDD